MATREACRVMRFSGFGRALWLRVCRFMSAVDSRHNAYTDIGWAFADNKRFRQKTFTGSSQNHQQRRVCNPTLIRFALSDNRKGGGRWRHIAALSTEYSLAHSSTVQTIGRL